MLVAPYVFFDGRCEEALAFYCDALDAEITSLVRYGDSPEPPPKGMIPPGSENKVMHATVRIGETNLHASDGHCAGQPNFQGFSLSLTVANAEESQRCFTALAEGGKVTMPLSPTFFSPSFGMLVDRFGIAWMVYVAQ